ncbi:MAG: hypothetical protein ABH854_05470 [Candidatus Diapherotrites archaeon]
MPKRRLDYKYNLRERAMALFKTGKNEREIAEELGLSRQRVNILKQELMPDRKSRRLPRETRKKVIELTMQGKTPRQVATEIGVGVNIATNYAIKLGKYVPTPQAIKWLRTPEGQKKLRRLFEEGKGDVEIAGELSLTSYNTASRWRKKLGYPPVTAEALSRKAKQRWKNMTKKQRTTIRIKKQETWRERRRPFLPKKIRVKLEKGEYSKAVELCYNLGAHSLIPLCLKNAIEEGKSRQTKKIYNLIREKGLKKTPATRELIERLRQGGRA